MKLPLAFEMNRPAVGRFSIVADEPQAVAQARRQPLGVFAKNRGGVMLKLIFVALGLLAALPHNATASPCNLNGSYRSNQLLTTLLSDNPSFQVTTDSCELTLNGGAINISAEAALESTTGGAVTVTGDAVLKGSARYRVVTRGRRSFLKITNIRRDIFTTRTFINGVLASERDLSGVVFGDGEIAFRCRGRNLDLFYEVEEASKRVRYTRR